MKAELETTAPGRVHRLTLEMDDDELRMMWHRLNLHPARICEGYGPRRDRAVFPSSSRRDTGAAWQVIDDAVERCGLRVWKED